jgi:hypothetical protein
VPAIFAAEHASAVTKAWNIGLGFGMIQAVPAVNTLTWDQTLRS